MESFVLLLAHLLVPSHQGKEAAVNLNQFTLVIAILENVWSRKLKLWRNRWFGDYCWSFLIPTRPGTLSQLPLIMIPFYV